MKTRRRKLVGNYSDVARKRNAEALKEYERATKPRHLVNGHAFNSAYDAMEYINGSEFQLERIEKILSISVYHLKAR